MDILRIFPGKRNQYTPDDSLVYCANHNQQAPMSTKVNEEFKRYPEYKQMCIHAFDRMVAKNIADGKEMPTWKTGQDVFDWWVDRRRKLPPELENQLSFYMNEGVSIGA